jgi:hypothetical protein
MERLRKDRERMRLVMSRLQSENKRLKLQDENTVVVIDTTTPNTGQRNVTVSSEKRGREEDSPVLNSKLSSHAGTPL